MDLDLVGGSCERLVITWPAHFYSCTCRPFIISTAVIFILVTFYWENIAYDFCILKVSHKAQNKDWFLQQAPSDISGSARARSQVSYIMEGPVVEWDDP